MKKPIFNVCLRVILPIIGGLTLLVMLATYWMIWNSCNSVSKTDKALSDSGVLTGHILLQAKEEGIFYEMYGILDSSETIAFQVSEEQREKIPYMEPSYYPTAYWKGEYEIMDLSGYQILDEGYGLGYLSQINQVKVYDFSAYKGHTQDMGRGPGLGLAFLWMAEAYVAGIAAFLDFVVGLVIFLGNRKRKRANLKFQIKQNSYVKGIDKYEK